MNTFCPQCGFGVKVDDDGCCVHCGAVATGEAVDQLFNDLAEQLPIHNASQPTVSADARCQQISDTCKYQEHSKHCIGCSHYGTA